MKTDYTHILKTVLIILALILVSCGVSEEKVHGTWQITEVNMELQGEFDLEAYDYYMEFSEGSEFSFCQVKKENGNEDCLKGKWGLKEAIIKCILKPSTGGFILYIDELSKKSMKGRLELVDNELTSSKGKIKMERKE